MSAFYCNSYCLIVILVTCCVVASKTPCSNCNRFQAIGQQLRNSRRAMGEEINEDDVVPPINDDKPKSVRSRCCPYDFDPNCCRTVGDRRLCGYNKNIGRPKGDIKIEQLSGGCRLRGDRLECGYEQGPFDNPRRPPGHDDLAGQGASVKSKREVSQGIIRRNLQRIPGQPIKAHDSTMRPKRGTKCMETADNRIVCRVL